MTTTPPALPDPTPDQCGHPAPPYRVRCEEDVLALVPLLLGFHPGESVVLLGVRHGGNAFVARVDLPRRDEERPPVVDALVGPAVRNGCGQVFLVAYTPHEPVASAVLDALSRELDNEGVEVLCRLRMAEGHWYDLGPGDAEGAAGAVGFPFDPALHPYHLASVVSGGVVHRDRAALAAGLAEDRSARAVAERQAVLEARGALPPWDPTRPEDRGREEAWLAATMAACPPLEAGEGAARVASDVVEWSSATVARLLRAVADPQVRGAAVRVLRRDNARDHVELWREVLRRSPRDEAASPAALLALAAWVSGHGALAWCAVERAQDLEPEHALAGLVAGALDAALPPTRWDEVARGDGEVPFHT